MAEVSAILSPCGTFRYTLSRLCRNTSGPSYAFFGVNPSTADALEDDATVRKWTGFVNAWGGSCYSVANVFAYRATNVKKLATVDDPVGHMNFHFQNQLIALADILVPCWGNRSKVPKQLRWHFFALLDRLKQSGKPVMCFGKTLSGDPKHPLFLPYDTKLEVF